MRKRFPSLKLKVKFNIYIRLEFGRWTVILRRSRSTAEKLNKQQAYDDIIRTAGEIQSFRYENS